MSGTVVDMVKGLGATDRLHLTFALRQTSDSGTPLKLLSSTLCAIIDSAPRARSLMDGVDRLLLVLGDRAASYMARIKVDKERDYPLLLAHGPQGMNELMIVAIQLGLVETQTNELKITIEGWKRIDDLRQSRPNSRRAFVAMWFDNTLDDAWLHGFQPGIERSKYFTAFRIDSVQHNGKIDDRIVAEIRRSGLVVADFTGQRGGVYFEAGYARGLGIPVVWTCREDAKDSLHFDTRQYNHIIWKDPKDLEQQLDARIAATLLPTGWTS